MLARLHAKTLILERRAEISISDFRSACDPFCYVDPRDVGFVFCTSMCSEKLV